MKRLLLIIILLLELLAAGSACNRTSDVILATTTSPLDSGLLTKLIAIFREKTGYNVKPIAVGSGQAIALGKRGEADVLLVHAPDLEEKFVAEGHGVERRPVMYNDYLVVGPSSDPAGIKGLSSALEALKTIAAKKAVFISRGDNSGTHQLEMRLWHDAGIEPRGHSWYQTTGQGMGQTLAVAAEKKGYTITDRATYLVTASSTGLAIMVTDDTLRANIYHIILVNPDKTPLINSHGARSFANFLTSAEAQTLIARFGLERFGQPLFLPVFWEKDHGTHP